jgi:hypothetical protein
MAGGGGFKPRDAVVEDGLSSVPGVAGFSLATYCKNEHDVDRLDVSIKGNVSVFGSSDDKLAKIPFGRATDQWIRFEYRDRLDEHSESCGCVRASLRDEMVEDAFDVIPGLWGHLDLSQA